MIIDHTIIFAAVTGIVVVVLIVRCVILEAQVLRLEEQNEDLRHENARLAGALQRLQDDVAGIPTLEEVIAGAERFFDHVYQRH